MPRKSQVLEKSAATQPQEPEVKAVAVEDIQVLENADSFPAESQANSDICILKFSAEVETFNSKLSMAMLAVPARPTHPALANVLITADAGQVTVVGFDLNLGISISFDDVLVETPGTIALPAKLLQNIVSRLPQGKIQVEAYNKHEKKGLVVSLASASGEYLLTGSVKEEWANFPEINSSIQFTLKSAYLVAALRGVLFAAATDETKQIITGVHFTFNAETIDVATTDSHRLAVAYIANDHEKLEVGGDVLEFTIPAAQLQQLERILSNGDEETVIVQIADSKINFSIGTTKLTCRLLEGQYPPYQQLLPTQLKTAVQVARRPLIDVLERLAVLVTKQPVLVVNFDPVEQLIKLSVSAIDIGTGVETIEAQIEGESLRIGLNIKYLLVGLKKLDTTLVQLQFNEPNTPIIISPIDSTISILQLLMPVQIP
ncbi:MAG TPA: DNA polymerase III subunit beta [Oculatellaceae cyanobacterium]|jgi:DNA polymerase-3 subunit beta